MSEDRLISRLAVRNFKSIREASLSLRPLTVLVGENSAGKSSILQSVFLLAQVTRSRARPGMIALNGMELNLGNFRDILHSSSEDGRVEITVTVPAEGPGVRRAPIRRQLSLQDQLDEEEGSPSIQGDWASWTLTLEDALDELGAAQVAGVRVSDDPNGQTLVVRPSSDPDSVAALYSSALRIRPHRRVAAGRMRLLDSLLDDFDSEPLYEGATSSVERAASEDEFFPSVALENGLPTELYVPEDESFVLADRWVRIALRHSSATSGGASWTALRLQARQEQEDASEGDVNAADLAEQLFPNFRAWVDEFDRAKDYRQLPRVDPWDEKTAGRAVLLGDSVARELSRLLQVDRVDPGALVPKPSHFLEIASSFGFSMGKVRYLGPLRAEPSPSYRPGQGGGVATLGMKGEFTVAMLHANRGLPVQCLIDGEMQRLPLSAAVDYWVQRFTVASGIHTKDLGRPGVELELLDPQTGQPRDLTSVGVGVSQLLPVLVICLLARPGELVLLEQPELHLHPGPQQILGDFLLDIAESGRQLLVETHSEYLINRLRLRVAEDEHGSAQDLVRIWYATRREGATEFKLMQPDLFGSFNDWPSGFFDQTTKESEAILRAVAQRRKGGSASPLT